jgi:hypothetical protein
MVRVKRQHVITDVSYLRELLQFLGTLMIREFSPRSETFNGTRASLLSAASKDLMNNRFRCGAMAS